jgi:hypothetical protein
LGPLVLDADFVAPQYGQPRKVTVTADTPRYFLRIAIFLFFDIVTRLFRNVLGLVVSTTSSLARVGKVGRLRGVFGVFEGLGSLCCGGCGRRLVFVVRSGASFCAVDRGGGG